MYLVNRRPISVRITSRVILKRSWYPRQNILWYTRNSSCSSASTPILLCFSSFWNWYYLHYPGLDGLTCHPIGPFKDVAGVFDLLQALANHCIYVGKQNEVAYQCPLFGSLSIIFHPIKCAFQASVSENEELDDTLPDGTVLEVIIGTAPFSVAVSAFVLETKPKINIKDNSIGVTIFFNQFRSLNSMHTSLH